MGDDPLRELYPPKLELRRGIPSEDTMEDSLQGPREARARSFGLGKVANRLEAYADGRRRSLLQRLLGRVRRCGRRARCVAASRSRAAPCYRRRRSRLGCGDGPEDQAGECVDKLWRLQVGGVQAAQRPVGEG